MTWLRIKRVDVGEVRVLRVGSQGCSELVVGGEIPIDLGVGIATLHDAHIVRIGQRRHAHSVIAVSQRLKQVQLSALERARQSEVGRSAFHTMRVAVDPAETGNGIFKEPLPLVGPAARVDLNHAAGKLAVLRGEGIRQHAH